MWMWLWRCCNRLLIQALLLVVYIHATPTPPIQVLGSIEVNTYENSLFEWNSNGTMYLLENIGCSYSQHAAKWFPQQFANASYARIRDFDTGRIVANITSTIGYGFITPFPDYDHEQLWLFGSKCNRCSSTPNFGCQKDRGVFAWKLLEDGVGTFQQWQRQELKSTDPTYNVQVTAVKENPLHPGTATSIDKRRTLLQQKLPDHRYAMIAEPLTIYINNNRNGNLFDGWTKLSTMSPDNIPIGGPSIRYRNGYYYILTGGHSVELIRTRDFTSWERQRRPFLQPSPEDAQAAPYNGFSIPVQEERGFLPMHNDWKRWDWNSNDADIAYTAQDSNKTWIIWGAGTQGKPPQPPLTKANHCTNVVGVAHQSMERLFRQYFQQEQDDKHGSANKGR